MKQLWNRLSGSINDMNLEKKILLILICVNVMIIGAFSLLGLKLVTDRFNHLLYQSMFASSNLFVRELESRLDSVTTMSNVIRINSTIQTHLDIVRSGENYRVTNSYAELYNALQKYYQEYKQKYMSFAAISNTRFTTFTYGYLYDQILEGIEEELITSADEGGGYPVWFTDHADESYLYLVRQIRKIRNLELENLGVLSVAIDMEKLLDEIARSDKKNEKTYWIFYQNGTMFYHSKQLSGTALENIDNTVLTYGIITLNNEKYFALRGNVEKYKWEFVHLVSYEAVASSQQTAMQLYSLMLIISLLLTFVLMHIILKRITRHIGVLLHKMRIFRGEESYRGQDVYDYSQRKDEIGRLHRQFDDMAAEIQRLIHNEYRNALLMKDAQIKSLESQINPHFLYNTLESVNWRAKAIGAEQISRMVESMGNFLRLTLSRKSESFTLGHEIEIVHSYMTIQQLRFDERLHFHMDIPEELYGTALPKLTIQPLVENAVHYALEKITEICSIIVTATNESGRISIYVKNTGSVFEENLIEKLQKREISGKGLGIALLNIQERIRLTYGEDYGITLYNEDEYAIARVTIPLEPTQKDRGEERIHDENYHC